MNAKLPMLAAAMATALGSTAVQAQEWVAKIGVTRYDTHSRTTGITGPGIPPGADAKTGDSTTMILVLERRFDANAAAELVIGIPPRVKARATGSVAFLGDDVLSAKNLAPTFIFNYHFRDPSAALRPYLGVGINYTRFGSIRSTLAPDVKMSDSVGPVVQAGLSYAINKQMGAFASIARVDVKSRVVAVASTVLTTDIDFAPRTYSAGLYYRF